MKRFAAAILIKDGKILLGKRSKTRDYYPNVWDFIGGHCAEGETFEAAMAREIEEEIGVIPNDCQHFLTVENPPKFTLRVFTVIKWSGEIINKQSTENEKIEWFSIDEALKLDFPDEEYKKVLLSISFPPSAIA